MHHRTLPEITSDIRSAPHEHAVIALWQELYDTNAYQPFPEAEYRAARLLMAARRAELRGKGLIGEGDVGKE